MKLNPAIAIDGYKVDHRRQYPDNTEVVFSNLTARTTRREYTDHMSSSLACSISSRVF